MKKALSALLVLLSLLLLSVSSLAVGTSIPIERISYAISEQNGSMIIPYTIPASEFSTNELKVWTDFINAYSSEDTTLVPLAVTTSGGEPWYEFAVWDSSKPVKIMTDGNLYFGKSVYCLVLEVRFNLDGSLKSHRLHNYSYFPASTPSPVILIGRGSLGDGSLERDQNYYDSSGKPWRFFDDLGIAGPIEHSLTINYQYEDGSQASQPYTGTFAEGESFNITTPVISGFYPSIEVVSGQMGDSDLSYTVAYTPIKHSLMINYQYEDGSQASQPYTGTFAEGESFNITTPVLSGFKPSINIVSGQMGNTDLSYTVTYTPIKHNLTINYQYENGSQALEPYSGTFSEGESFSITVPVIGGYKSSVSVISGKMENKDLTYIVTYTPVTHTVEVKYHFEDGSQAAEPYTGSFAEGQPYSIPTPIIEGFTPSLSIISGEMGTGDLSYTVIFTKDKEPEPPPSSSEDSSSGGESSGGGSSGGESSGGGSSGGSSSGGGSSGGSSSGGSSSGGGSGEGSSGGRGYVVWNPALVAQGFKNVSNQAGMAFNTGIWVFLGITGIVLMIKLLRDLFK